MKRLLGHLGPAIVTLLLGLAATELALRALGYRYSPVALLPPRTGGDFRAAHTLGSAYSVFDDELIWRLDGPAAQWLNEQGFRGPLASADRDPRVTLIVALGDSNTAGPQRESYHWPGDLSDLANLNVPQGRRVHVVNAAVFGYSSFQGLRRFRQIARYRPDIVYFSFGSNDAQRVRLSDADYAKRLERLGWLSRLRLGPPLAAALWDRLAADASRPMTHRVPPDQYRHNLEEFVAGARAVDATPVLLTRPYRGSSHDPDYWITYAAAYNEIVREVARDRRVPLVEIANALAGRDDLFVDDSHLRRQGYRLMAEMLVSHLRTLGVVAGEHRYANAVEPGRLDDARLELRSGLWGREQWAGKQPGRWTAREAEIVLERRGDEAGLELEGRFHSPSDRSSLRVEANGVPIGVVEGPNGEFRRRLDLRRVREREVVVRLVSEQAFVVSGDARTLGAFLCRVALVASPYAAEVRLADVVHEAPELGEGWWEPEDWGRVGRGRWTKDVAMLHLGRRGTEDRLLLEISGDSPEGFVTLRVEANGRLMRVLRVDNTQATYSVELPSVVGPSVGIRLVAERTFVPRLAFGSQDGRKLGVFVHAARLAGDFEGRDGHAAQ